MMQRLNSWYGSCAVDLRIFNKESAQIIINNNKNIDTNHEHRNPL